jgi:hypothetical protein
MRTANALSGTAAVAALLMAVAAFAAVDTVTVIVRKTSIRRDRHFYAPALAEADFGDSFNVVSREKGWVRVSTRSGEGWLHETAVTAKKVAASSQGPGAAVADEDVALAGKGFNPQVESEYRRKNPEADFDAVDRMERLEIGENSVAAFVHEGNLHTRERGQ